MNILIGIIVFHLGLLLLCWALDSNFCFSFIPLALAFWGVAIMFIGIAFVLGGIGL